MFDFLRLLRSFSVCAVAVVASSVAISGPVIIGGTDAEDHGSATASANLDGWLYMQRAMESIARQVTNNNKRVVCIGCNGQAAVSAFTSAFDKSNLPAAGWTRVNANSAAEIAAFLQDAAASPTPVAGIIYMPSDRLNAAGGITEAQIDAVTAGARGLDRHVNGGGGLFVQTQGGVANGFAWLKALIPGLLYGTENILPDTGLTLTAAAVQAYPTLTSGAIGSASQWHNYFGGNFGGLSVLAVGALSVPADTNAPVILGGGVGASFTSPTGLTPSRDDPEAFKIPVGGTAVWSLLIAALALLARRRLRAHP
jgi:hypothetical protein